MNRTAIVLDVGCGDNKVPGSVGMDCVRLAGVDIVHDLSQYPWPIDDASCEIVWMNQIIEHLPNTVRVMEEVYRILKAGGKVHIHTGYWNHRHSISDPQHVSFFNEVTWEFFTGQRKAYYTHARFTMERFEFTYDYIASAVFLRQKWLMRILSYFLCNVIDGMKVTLVKSAHTGRKGD